MPDQTHVGKAPAPHHHSHSAPGALPPPPPPNSHSHDGKVTHKAFKDLKNSTDDWSSTIQDLLHTLDSTDKPKTEQNRFSLLILVFDELQYTLETIRSFMKSRDEDSIFHYEVYTALGSQMIHHRQEDLPHRKLKKALTDFSAAMKAIEAGPEIEESEDSEEIEEIEQNKNELCARASEMINHSIDEHLHRIEHELQADLMKHHILSKENRLELSTNISRTKHDLAQVREHKHSPIPLSGFVDVYKDVVNIEDQIIQLLSVAAEVPRKTLESMSTEAISFKEKARSLRGQLLTESVKLDAEDAEDQIINMTDDRGQHRYKILKVVQQSKQSLVLEATVLESDEHKTRASIHETVAIKLSYDPLGQKVQQTLHDIIHRGGSIPESYHIARPKKMWFFEDNDSVTSSISGLPEGCMNGIKTILVLNAPVLTLRAILNVSR